MPRIAGAVALILLTGACLLPMAELEQGPGILGSYVVNGIDPIGTEYTGRVSISRGANPDDVVIEWVITGAILHGEGSLADDTLSVRWKTVTSPRGPSSGRAEYEVLDDGRLIGTRTVDGSTGIGTETIFPDP